MENKISYPDISVICSVFIIAQDESTFIGSEDNIEYKSNF